MFLLWSGLRHQKIAAAAATILMADNTFTDTWPMLPLQNGVK
jgi:hypothetical protein